MKKDFSLEIFNKLISLNNRKIELILNDHSVMEGEFVGFFRGAEEFNESYIVSWHFIATESTQTSILDSFVGEIILQNNIFQIRFLEDQSVMVFK